MQEQYAAQISLGTAATMSMCLQGCLDKAGLQAMLVHSLHAPSARGCTRGTKSFHSAARSGQSPVILVLCCLSGCSAH